MKRRLLPTVLFVVVVSGVRADDKPVAAEATKAQESGRPLFRAPEETQNAGKRTSFGSGDAEFPLLVVRGTPYEMGRQLGRLLKHEIHAFIPRALAGVAKELGTTEAALAEVWMRSAAYADDRIEQELLGLADGSGMPLATLQAMHAAPLVMPYSCSAIAAWGSATEDGRLYQTRNLDWSMKVGAHDFPAVVVYLPNRGAPHIVPTFAGFIGAHTGLNARGIALSEMGDSSRKEAPYPVHAPHFTVYFRTMLYDSQSLTQALEIFRAQPQVKRYHFVFGDGQVDKRAVKVRAHAPAAEGERLKIWRDNDAHDETAPNVLSCVVYNDEGRGAFPALKREAGKLDAAKLIDLANKIPIKGGNVENVVYDATGLRMWVSYAKGGVEAYKRPYAMFDFGKLLQQEAGDVRSAAR
jgi:hypothetical protein